MKPHGVSGAVLVASDPTVHDVFVPGLRCLLRGARGDSAPEMVVVESATRYGAGLRLRLVGIDTRDAAARLAGARLEMTRAEMPEPADDEYYDYQIIGLQAVDPHGRALGEVVEIIPTGASDVYVISNAGKELLVPATSRAILAVEPDRRRIVVDPDAAVRSP